MKRLINRGALALLALAFAGCDEKLSSITGPTPDLNTTFSSLQRTIFNTSDSSGRLSCISCHTDQGRNAAGPGLVLLEGRSYNALVGRPSVGKVGEVFVRPGDPDNSYLVKKLEGHSSIAGQRMPRGNGPFLTEGQMLVIRRWILEGAQNN